MDGKMKKVAAMLRSVIQSSKDGIAVHKLPGEYRMIVGEVIPFQELGHANLMSMLKSMPDVVRLGRNSFGEDVVFAVADENTAHIQSLISRQKSTKSKVKPSLRPFRRRAGAGSWKPPHRAVMSSSFGNYINKSRPTGFTPRRKPVSGYNFLDRVPPRSLPSPPPQAAMQAQARPKSTFVLPPRFHKQQERAAVRMDSPILPEPVYTPPSPTYVPSRKVPEREDSRVAAAPRDERPKAFEQGKFTQSVIFDFESLRADLPTTTFVSYQPSLAPSFVPKRTVVVEPLEIQKKVEIADEPVRSLPGPVKRGTGFKITKRRSTAETSKELVEEYAVYHGYDVLYRTLPIATKKKGTAYVSTLEMNKVKYLSYPTEKATPEEAEEAAANKAVTVLSIVPGQYVSARRETQTLTKSQMQTVVEQLYEIIKNKPNGVWQTKMPGIYQEMYSHTLPANWLDILRENSSAVEFERAGENYILYPAPSSPTNVIFEENRALSSPTATNLFVSRPKELILPASKEWDVYVTHISDDLTVAVRLIDSSDEFTKLADAMNDYYSTNRKPVVAHVGHVYAVKSEDEYFRVKVVQLCGDQAECYFLDNGDSEKVSTADLNALMPQFCTLPNQAIQCELHGVNYTESSTVCEKLFDLAFGKVLVAEVLSRDPLSVRLYDTSTDEDVNINEVLADTANIETITPRLPEGGKIVEGFLTHVTDTGVIYLQLSGSNLDVLENITSDISQLCEDRKGLVTEASQSKMYCARYDNGRWYRAFIRDISPEHPEMVVVWFVDFGNTSVVRVSDLCEADEISKMLALLPYQAITCRLHNVPTSESQNWSKEASDYLCNIVPENTPILIKVTKPGTDLTLPEVSLFKRTGQQKELVSVNETLAVEADLFVTPPARTPSPVQKYHNLLRLSTIPDVALSAHMSTINIQNGYSESSGESARKSTSTMVPADIPEVGSHFDVMVTLAAQPHNFTVQPWQSGTQLDHVMDEMQAFYNIEENICDMHECLLKEGDFYACHFKDNRWYRTLAIKVMPDETVWVYFIDFGDYCMMALENVQPLYGNFRSLPFQAIKASLHDVLPVGRDWSPMDCMYFQELVVDKPFVSVIKTKSINTSNSIAIYELGLTLIDTSNPAKDVYIHELLIQKGCAKLRSPE